MHFKEFYFRISENDIATGNQALFTSCLTKQAYSEKPKFYSTSLTQTADNPLEIKFSGATNYNHKHIQATQFNYNKKSKSNNNGYTM